MNDAIQSAGGVNGWSRRRAKKAARLARIAPWMKGPVLETGAIVEALAGAARTWRRRGPGG